MYLETDEGSGEYNLSEDNDFPTSGYYLNEEKSSCENGGVLSWDSASKRVRVVTNASDKCYAYFNKGFLFSEYIVDLRDTYTIVHNESVANSAKDGSFRYCNDTPKNFVCFGSDEETCPNDNLYRIIGVFDNQVKLIKSTSIGVYNWYTDSSNNRWQQSTLNKEVLNGTYLSSLDEKWQEMIAIHTWKVGGANLDISSANPKTFIDREANLMDYNAKIGLMSLSDYGFATYPTYWTTPLESFDERAVKNNNWLLANMKEWTINTERDQGLLPN